MRLTTKRKFIFIAFSVLAFSGYAQAVQDAKGSVRPAMWRSSRTCVAENFVLIATGEVHIHQVIVETPTVNSSSWISFFNSSSPAEALSNFNIATAAFVPTNMRIFQYTPAVADDVAIFENIEWPKTVVYDQYYSSGAVVSKVGVSCTNTFWDYVVPRTEPLVPFSP